MSVRAKFRCHSIAKSGEGDSAQASISMAPVYANKDGSVNEENKSFSKWTPSGSLQMTITNPAAFDQFEEGADYYLDFTPAT